MQSLLLYSENNYVELPNRRDVYRKNLKFPVEHWKVC